MSAFDGEPAFEGLEDLKEVPIAPGVAIGAIALNMALKYHGISTISDGAMYQQYKLEGRNIRELGLVDVFDTAMQIERHLLATSDRIAEVLVDALSAPPEDEEERND